MLSNFLIILVVKEKIKVKISPAIPTGASTVLKDELAALKTFKTLSM